MSKGTLTIDGSRAILDFGNATRADAAAMDEILLDSVIHLEVRGDNITHINNNFLYLCESLTSIDLSGFQNVTSIGDGFLEWCESLTSVDLTPLKNVTSVGHDFLYGCTSLKSVDLSPLEKNIPNIRERFHYLPHNTIKDKTDE